MIKDEHIKGLGLKECMIIELPNEKIIYKADHVVGGKTISRYLFYGCSVDELECLASNNERYEEFENKNIAPLFYQIQGDLSWSLYLVFVLPGGSITRLTNEVSTVIQSSKRYARKLIVEFPDLARLVPVAKTDKGLNDKLDLVSPDDDWWDTLEKAGLLFCLFDYRTESLEKYLDGAVVDLGAFPVMAATSLDDTTHNTGYKLAEINVGSLFRPHCLQDLGALKLENVNVLFGSNGSGKTSILDAIELAVTGTNGRNRRAPGWDGYVLFRNGEKYAALPEPHEKKERERFFYRNREKRTDKLNVAFRRYNYFSNEDVFDFVHGKVSYEQVISTIVFGENLSYMQKCLEGYLKRFEDMERRLEAEIHDKQREFRSMDLRWRQLSEVGLEDPSVDFLRSLFDRSGLETEEFLEERTLSVYETRLLKVQAISAELSGCEELTPARLHELHKEVMERYSILSRAQKDCEMIQYKLSEEAKKIESLKGLMARGKSLLSLIDKRSEAEEFHRIVAGKRVLEDQLSLLQYVTQKWNWLADQDPIDLPEDKVVVELERLEKELNSLQKDRMEHQRALETAEAQFNETSRLIARLKALGKDILSHWENNDICPLCAHKHETPEQLLLAVENNENVDPNSEIVQLYDLVARADKAIQACTQRIEKGRSVLRVIKESTRLRDFVLTYMHELIDESMILTGTNQGLLIALNRKLCDIRGQVAECDSKLKVLEELGVSSSSLKTLESFYAELKDYLPNARVLSSSSLMHDLEALLSDHANLFKHLEATVASHASRAGLPVKELPADVQLATLREEMAKVAERNRVMQVWVNALGRLHENGARISEEQTVASWRARVETAIEIVGKLRRFLFEAEQRDALTVRRYELAKQIGNLEDKRRRCVFAVQTLRRLRPLSYYVESFLEAHIESIGALFEKLHAPREFEQLKLQNRELVALRKQSSTYSSIREMSSGQRLALVLAVFFTLHLSMKSAFPFVLLDEPVVNLDDLNLLSLLDFLRELHVSNGTQIILTTANPQVASLVRRKFSFLGNDFQSIEITRVGVGPSYITARKYDQNRESAISTLRVG